MKTKNFFIVKFVAVTMMLGLFSPSISIQDVEVPTKYSSTLKHDIPQNLFAKLASSEITFTVLKEAEARRHKRRRYKKARRKAVRRGHRRANYRHHRRSERRRNVVGAVVTGAVVGAVVNQAARNQY